MADENLIGLKLHNEKNNRLTIESLQAALFALMKTEEFSAISITDICKKRGSPARRSTGTFFPRKIFWNAPWKIILPP